MDWHNTLVESLEHAPLWHLVYDVRVCTVYVFVDVTQYLYCTIYQAHAGYVLIESVVYKQKH